MRFWLGAHQPHWLADAQRPPLFVSDRQLRERRTLPAATGPWAADSGAFSTLAAGREFDPPAVYAARLARYRDEIGHLAWAAPQDWMCEPFMVAKTGKSVDQHQALTVGNYLDLRAAGAAVIPVLQGWTVPQYLACVERYQRAGVDLTREPLVGLGSVCRRQATGQAEQIITALYEAGVRRLHGFGVKVLGLRRYGHMLASADSMAWSFAARRKPPLPGCVSHINCANCRKAAYPWHAQVVAAISRHPGYIEAPLFSLAGDAA